MSALQTGEYHGEPTVFPVDFEPHDQAAEHWNGDPVTAPGAYVVRFAAMPPLGRSEADDIKQADRGLLRTEEGSPPRGVKLAGAVKLPGDKDLDEGKAATRLVLNPVTGQKERATIFTRALNVFLEREPAPVDLDDAERANSVAEWQGRLFDAIGGVASTLAHVYRDAVRSEMDSDAAKRHNQLLGRTRIPIPLNSGAAESDLG